MLTAQCDRRCPQPPSGAARHAEIDHCVVFQNARRNARYRISRQAFNLLPCDKAGHVHGMNTTIGKLRRYPRLCGIITPTHTRVIRIGRVGMVTMGKFGKDHANGPQIPACDHGPHMTHKRIACVAIVHRANAPRGAGDFDDLFALFDRHGHGFFAQNVKARFKERFGYFKMCRVWRRDGHQINPIVTPAFACQHFAPIAISAVRGDA